MRQNCTQEMSKSQGVSPKTLMKYTAAKQIIKYYYAYYVISLHYIMEIVKYHKNVFFCLLFLFVYKWMSLLVPTAHYSTLTA